ncbi:S-adenosyl-L-methionine dependent methyltransferase [Trametes cingulata]|nr:S-adenosyl-L-methionine dependent methyltransferase [Trametes cingulata]
MDSSATAYTTFFLRVYDFLVLFVANTFAWRCPTRSTLLPFYKQHIGDHAHLDIGIGTGYYPAASAAELAKLKLLTLVDLNPNTLAHARARLGTGPVVETVEQSVFEPFPEGMHGRYDSVALFHLFHCLPGAFPGKATAVFANVTPVLAPGGVVYGSTVLGKGVGHNWFGRRLIAFNNGKGVFSNLGDSEGALREGLGDVFEEYDVRVVGRVALFWGHRPKTMVATTLVSSNV